MIAERVIQIDRALKILRASTIELRSQMDNASAMLTAAMIDDTADIDGLLIRADIDHAASDLEQADRSIERAGNRADRLKGRFSAQKADAK
jgi:hypothetical protein